MAFGERLKKLRKEKGIKQEDLAKLLNVVKSTVSQWEKEIQEPRDRKTYLEIANYFGVPVDYLVGGDTIPPNAFNFDKIAVPVYGVIRAGEPIFANENIIDWEYIPRELARSGDYFCLKVIGDSMKNIRINEGDTVLIRKQPIAENGAIVAALINNEGATIKRFYQQNGKIILKPENEEYAPQVYDAEDVKILGEVVKAIIDMRKV